MTLDDLRYDLKAWAAWKSHGEGGYVCPLALVDTLKAGGFGPRIPRAVTVPPKIQRIMRAMDEGQMAGGSVGEAISAVQMGYLSGWTSETAEAMGWSYTTLCARRREGELYLLGRLRGQ